MARQIATAAARLFAIHGYDATSVRAICEVCGVTKPTLYYHFGSKEGLAQALLREPLAALVAELETLRGEVVEPREFMGRILDRFFEFIREDPDRARFLITLFFGPLGSSLATEVQRFRERFQVLVHETIDRMSGTEAIAPALRARYSQAIRGVILSSMVDHLHGDCPLEPGAGPRMVRDLLNGFRHEGSEPGTNADFGSESRPGLTRQPPSSGRE